MCSYDHFGQVLKIFPNQKVGRGRFDLTFHNPFPATWLLTFSLEAAN